MMRQSTPKVSLRHRLSDLFSIFNEVLIENSDGNAAGRRGFLTYSLVSGMIAACISGTYFTGLLLEMNASETYISYLNMMITVCGFLQFVAPIFLEKMKKRKTFLIVSRIIYHIFNIILVGIIPIMPAEQNLLLILFFAATVVINAISSLTAPGYSIWHMQSLPAEKRPGFFTISGLGSTILSYVVSFVTARYVDIMEEGGTSFFGISPTFSAFLVLRVIAIILAVIEIYSFTKIKEYPYEVDPNAKNNRGLRLLLHPLGNKKFMLTITMLICVSFNTSLMGSYFTIYMLDEINMSYTYLSLSGFISIPAVLIMTPVWSYFIRRHKWYNMRAAANAAYAFAYIGNVLITANTHWMYLIVMIIVNLAKPCISILDSTIVYMNMPETNRTAYISFYSLCTALATFLGNFLGMKFMQLTESIDITLFGFTMVNNQYMNIVQFAISMIVTVYMITVGRRVTEK
ncbi:MAG: MFS transporter [Ruminococcaceae bacterium]|nr:MFS transporter [Oscillospiraceae bacterium]